MPEIKLCDVFEGSIKMQSDEHLHVSMTLPKTSTLYNSQPLPSDNWVLETYRKLLNDGYAKFATNENPTHPFSAGTIDIVGDFNTGDYYVLLTRKDLFSPRDPGGHVPSNGFAIDESEWVNPSLIVSSEGAEERFFYTKDGNLLVPHDARGVYGTIEAATRLGLLKFEDRSIIKDGKISYLPGPDIIDVYDHNDDLVHTTSGYFAWSSKTGPNIIKLRQIQADIHDLIPYDGEGIFKRGGSFFPFNREVFVFSKQDLQGLAYSDEIIVNRDGSENSIYVWETNQGKRQIQTQKPEKMEDRYKPCPVVQRVLAGMGITREFRADERLSIEKLGLPIDFNATTNEISQTIKRMQGHYDQNPV